MLAAELGKSRQVPQREILESRVLAAGLGKSRQVPRREILIFRLLAAELAKRKLRHVPII